MCQSSLNSEEKNEEQLRTATLAPKFYFYCVIWSMTLCMIPEHFCPHFIHGIFSLSFFTILKKKKNYPLASVCAQSWSANRTRDYAGEWFGDEHWCEVRGGEFLQGEKSCWHRIRESDLTLGFTIGRFLETKNIIYRSYYFFIMRCLSIKPQISNKHQFGHTHTGTSQGSPKKNNIIWKVPPQPCSLTVCALLWFRQWHPYA